ncbi:MAG: hypothetical protein RSC68_19040 [Acinetobacter sp.]
MTVAKTENIFKAKNSSGSLYWSADPRVFADETKKKARQLRASIVREIFEYVVANTPVMTGRARRSWKVSVGKMDRTYIARGGRKRPYPPPGMPGYKRLSEVPLKEKIYISNSTPYIKYLEYGSPTTKEHAMLRRAIARAQKWAM